LVFITINLYTFILCILCILNNFLKTYLKIITEGFTNEIYLSAFDSSCHSHRRIYRWIYLIGIIHSPTTLPTNRSVGIWQYLPQWPKNVQTDIFSRYFKHSPTHLPTVWIRRYVCHTITDGINLSVYFKRETFFCQQFLSVKPSENVFLFFRQI